ncbi:MAG: trimethoprim-resistant dihydrofolate reductase DfrA [Halioglobus sp.]
MKLSLMAAVSKNGIIGNGPDIPWQAKGEQLLFKAITYNQWLLVGRKTFEAMGVLPNRKYAVISRSAAQSIAGADADCVRVFASTDAALAALADITDHVIVAGGGEIYKHLISKVDTLHVSEIDIAPEGDVFFPDIPEKFSKVFEQQFESNVNYTYQIWRS